MLGAFSASVHAESLTLKELEARRRDIPDTTVLRDWLGFRDYERGHFTEALVERMSQIVARDKDKLSRMMLSVAVQNCMDQRAKRAYTSHDAKQLELSVRLAGDGCAIEEFEKSGSQSGGGK